MQTESTKVMNVYIYYKFEKSEIKIDEIMRLWRQNDHTGKPQVFSGHWIDQAEKTFK